MKKILILLLITFLALPVFAEENEDGGSENGVTSSGEIFLLISTLPEAKLGYTHTFKFPVMQGDNPLTSGNNIKLSLTAEATPISLNGIFKTVLTPVAFLEFAAGGRIGTGWPLELFGGYIYGTGLNLASDVNVDGEYYEEYKGKPFDSVFLKGFAGGTFQFDFAAIFPGDWNHVVFQSYHEISYHTNTNAANDQSWYFESDDGENMNGLNYLGNFTLGYQMPIILSMVALQAEWAKYLYDTSNRANWGDDLVRWTFSGILMFKFNEKFGSALIVQCRTRRNFTNFDEHKVKDDESVMHYRSRILDTSNPQRLEFYRVAAAITYTF